MTCVNGPLKSNRTSAHIKHHTNHILFELLLYYSIFIISHKCKFNTTHHRCRSVIENILKPKGMLCNADLNQMSNNQELK